MKPIWLLFLMAIIGILSIVMGYHETIQREAKWMDRFVGVVLVVCGFLMAIISTASLSAF